MIGFAGILRLGIPALAYARSGDVRVFHTADSPQYLAAARSLWLESRYDGLLGPELLRPPGYPVFLLPGVAMGHPEFWAVGAQALLGCLTVWVVWRAARRLAAEPGVAAVAALIVAIDPTQLAWSGRVMAETPFTLLVSLALLGLVEHRRTGSPAALAMTTLAAAASAYFRFVGYALPAILAMTLLLVPSITPRRGRMGAAAAVLAGGFLLFMPWHVRNGLVADYWGFSSQPDRLLAFSTSAALEARESDASMTELRARSRSEALDPGRETGALYRQLRRPALERLLDQPLAVAQLHLAGSLRTLFLPGTLSLLEALGPLPPPERATSREAVDGGLLGALSLATGRLWLVGAALVLVQTPIWLGIALAVRRRRELWLLVPVVLLALASGGPWGSSRFRHPVVPFLALAAASGFASARRTR